MRSATMKNSTRDFTERELRNSGLPPAGAMGAAKGELKALAIGIGVLVLIIIAAIVDMQL